MLLCRDSQYVVNLIDHFEYDNETVIISKYAEGGDLLNYCLAQKDQSCWVSEDRACHIFTQLAKGVRDMHRQGLVHRDLKLLNIFITDRSDYPKVKIGDLGLACKLEEDECTTKKCGTTAFMPPEIILGQEYDFKSDIWSLGIILYSLLATSHPFEPIKSKKDLEDKICNSAVSFEGAKWEGISNECQLLIAAMLEKPQESRCSIDYVLSHPWITQNKKTAAESQ